MNLALTYGGAILWIIYYTLYEVLLHHKDKVARRDNNQVPPDLITLSGIRYKAAWGAFIIILIVVSIANYFTLHNINLKYLIGVNALELAIMPVLIYIVFYVVAKFLISRAKREELYHKLDKTKDE